LLSEADLSGILWNHRGLLSFLICTFFFISWPRKPDQKRAIADGFLKISRIPHVLGAIDGTHIPIIMCFPDRGSFTDKDAIFSLNMQAICDHKGLFLNVCTHEI
jgi:hypothetical protein